MKIVQRVSDSFRPTETDMTIKSDNESHGIDEAIQAQP